jgi:LAO/AO transport system kinase
MRLAEDILRGDARAAAQLITALEAGTRGATDELAALQGHRGRAHVVGITGAPGIGKSTLVGSVVGVLRARGHTVAVLAVDPSSPLTGGAILGDRIRMQQHAADDGVFIRSLGTRGALGGLARVVSASVEVLDAMGKNFVLVETVGAGQSEVDVHALAHTTVLVLSADSGDAVQVMKAGIMELADLFVVNKADKPGAESMVSQIELMLQIRSTSAGAWKPRVLTTDALAGKGVELLVDEIGHRESVRESAQAEPEPTVRSRPVREGLWEVGVSGEPRLIGSKCTTCGEVFFPRRPKGICTNCQQTLADVSLGPDGVVYSFTTVMQRPPIYYQGPVPYVLAWVELAEGVRVEALLTGLPASGPSIGMPVHLAIETLHQEPDGEIVTAYKFAPTVADIGPNGAPR